MNTLNTFSTRRSAPQTYLTMPDHVQLRRIVGESVRDLAGQFDVDQLLERILKRAVSLLESSSGSISLVDERSGTYTKMVDLSVGCHAGETFPISEGVTGEVVRARSGVIFDEYAAVYRGHIDPTTTRYRSSVIAVPMLHGDNVIGAFVVFGAGAETTFTARDLNLLELFADHAALALVNAEAHRQTVERMRTAVIASERERTLRDLHETLSTKLTRLVAHLDAAQALDSETDADRVGKHIRLALDSAEAALADTRRTTIDCGADSLGGRSLHDAVRAELDWVNSTAGALTSLVIVGDERPLANETVHQAFRIVQELLNNVVRHAEATKVRVGLLYESSAFAVMVEDDGVGFAIPAALATEDLPHRQGLRQVRSRTQQIGGDLSVTSTPGWGTQVRVQLPDTPSLSEDPQARRMRVLIACRRPVDRSGIARLLNLAEPGLHVVGELDDPSTLVSTCDLLAPDIVVADIDVLLGADRDSEGNLQLPGDPSIVVSNAAPTAGTYRAGTRFRAKGYLSHDATGEQIARTLIAAGRGETLLDAENSAWLNESAGPSAEALTAREHEVRDLVTQGLPDKQIATALHISVKTVEKHVGSLLRKTGVHNRTMLAQLDLERVNPM
jgi:signal transduction histidine kinase/DNA-binding NarL/FixJ family response regulator